MSNPITIPKPESEVVSYFTMRKTIGWMGMSLPFLLLGGNYLLNTAGVFTNKLYVRLHDTYLYENEGSLKSSVSHYYYTTVGEVFTGVLFAVALFMICYTGHPKRKEDRGLSDNAMTNLAGFFALGVIAFPTSSDSIMKDNLRLFISSETIGYIHFGFALLFFVDLAIMSMVNFRRAANPALFGKGEDDPFYLKCGIIMIACIVLIPICASIEAFKSVPTTFILEAVALIFFGLSWLKKGKADFAYIPKKVMSIIKPGSEDATQDPVTK